MSFFDRSKYILNIPTIEDLEEQQQQPVTRNNNQGRIGDTIDALQMGAIKGTAGIIDMAGTLTGSSFVKNIAQKFYGWGDDQLNQMSERGRTAFQQQIFEEDENGKFTLGAGATNFDTWLLNIANGLGQFAPIVAGGGAGLAARAAGAARGTQSAVTTGGFVTAGGSMATGMGGNEARTEVKEMPQEVLDAAPIYQNLVDGIRQKKPELSEQEVKDRARNALAEQLAKEAMTDPKALLANFGMSAISDPILGRALMGARLGKGFLGSVGKGALVEAPTEFVQGGTQALVNNEVLSQIDGRDIWDGVLIGAANEAVIGGAVGGTIGGATYPFGRNQDDNKDQPPPSNTGSPIAPGNAPVVNPDPAMNLPPEMEAELNRGVDPAVAAVAEQNPILGAELNKLDQATANHSQQIQQILNQQPAMPAQPAQVGSEYWQSSGDLLSEFMPPTQSAPQQEAPATSTLNDARKQLTDSLVEQALAPEITPQAPVISEQATEIAQPKQPQKVVDAAALVGRNLGTSEALQSDDAANRIAYDVKTDTYSANKFDPETAARVEQELAAAGYKYDFPAITIDEKPRFGTSGGYDKRTNLIHISNNPKEFSDNQSAPDAMTPARTVWHEVGHYGFMNLLTGQERVEAASAILGDLKKELIPGKEGHNYPRGKFDNLDEYVAEMYSNWKRDLPTDERLTSYFQAIDSRMDSSSFDQIQKAIADADKMVSESRKPQQQPAEQAKQDRLERQITRSLAEELLSELTFKTNGQPFKSAKEALASGSARQAKKNGSEVEAVNVGDGYGWRVVQNQVDDTNVVELNSDQAAVTPSPETDTAPQAAQEAQAMPANEPVKWFGTKDKADAWVSKQKDPASYRVEQSGRSRFEIYQDGKSQEDASTETQAKSDADFWLNEMRALQGILDQQGRIVDDRTQEKYNRAVREYEKAVKADQPKVDNIIAKKGDAFTTPNGVKVTVNNDVTDTEQVVEITRTLSTGKEINNRLTLEDFKKYRAGELTGEAMARKYGRQNTPMPNPSIQSPSQAVQDYLDGKRDDIPTADEVEGELKANLQKAESKVKPAESKTAETAAPIEDFGEKIGGARKDVWGGFSDAINSDASTAELPLSKSFPEPDYVKMAADGVPMETLALIAAMRAEIPAKPRTAWKVRSWAEKVDVLRGFAADLINGDLSTDEVIKAMRLKSGDLGALADAVPAIAKANPETLKLAAKYRLSSGSYSMFRGQEYRPNKVFYMPQHDKTVIYDLASDNKQAALDNLSALIAAEANANKDTPGTKQSKIDVYQNRYTKQVYLGWKGGSGVLKIQDFPSVTAARDYLKNNRAEVEAKLERIKETPGMRRAENRDRIGPPRFAGNVTPAIFADTFGFRGVEFGNWVEQGRRQKDLNEAYDALMDLAEVLGIPPKALALNGELGMAFGARGKGGKRNAKAHYERSYVVINLTKEKGAGSLAHEWWHAVDNYFARSVGKKNAFATDGTSVRGDAMRKEVRAAFDEVMSAIRKSGLIQRSAKLDQRRSKPYWSTTEEASARSFEAFIIAELEAKGFSNDYLANIIEPEAWNALEEMQGNLPDQTYPYPTKAEQAGINPAYRNLFDTLQTKETDKGTMLFSKASTQGTKPTRPISVKAAERAADSFIKTLSGAAGIKVVVLPSQKDAEKLWRMSLDGAFIRGAYDDKTGTAYVIADNLESTQELREVIAHEIFAHGGLDKVIGADKKQQFLDRILQTRNNKAFAELWAQIDEDYAKDSDAVKAEELFAYYVQNQPQRGPVKFWWNAFKRWLNNVLASLGITKKGDPDVDLMQSMMESIMFGFQFGRQADSNAEGDMAFSKDGDVTETEAFKKWFGDSKVVDEDGKPLVVYHGTQSPEFNAFTNQGESNLFGVGEQHYFTDSYLEAEGYAIGNADTKSKGRTGRGRVISSYLKMENPANLTSDNWNVDDIPVQDFMEDMDMDGLYNAIKDAGYDGIIYDGDIAPIPVTGIHYVVFGSNQIKSATENNGDFDPTNPDIRFSKDSENFAPATVNTDADTALPTEFVALLDDAINTANEQSPEPLTVKELKEIIEENFNDAVSFDGLEMDMSFAQALKQAEVDGVITFTPTIAGTKRGKANDARNERDREQNERVAAMDALPAELRSKLSSLAQELAYLNGELESVNADSALSQFEKAKLRRELQADIDSVQGRYNEARAEAEQVTGIRFSKTKGQPDNRTAREKIGQAQVASQTISDRIKNTVDTIKDSSWWKAVGTRAAEGIFDGLYGIFKAEQAAGITDPNKMGYVSARLATGLGDMLHALFSQGALEWKGGVTSIKKDTKGLLEVFSMLPEDNGLNNWLAWMAANRAENLMAEGRENNLTEADIAELKALAKGNEALFEEVRKEYNKINSATLDLAEQAGLISAEQRAGFDEEWYVPFFREMDVADPDLNDVVKAIKAPFTTKTGIVGQSANIKALIGGTQSTQDLLQNIIQRQVSMIDAAVKNNAAREVAGNLDGTGYMTKENSPEFDAAVDALGMTRQELATKHQKVRIMENGKPVYYYVHDAALLRGLMQVHDVGSKALFNKMARSAKRFLTTGVTLSPDFIIRNFIRDAAHAWMVNKDGAKLGTDTWKGLKASWQGDPNYWKLIASGAAFQGGYIHGADPEAAQQQIRRALRAKGMTTAQVDGYMASIVTTKDKMLQVFEKYRQASDKLENSNRMTVYERAIAAGKSERQALFESKDLMDYSLKGNFGLMGTLIDMLPFFNARLQGLYKLGRAAKADGDDQVFKVLSRDLAMKGLKVAAFSTALAMMYGDDERYKQLPEWDKDAHWHFFLGEGTDGHIRIPKPFELGIIFGTMPERLFNFSAGNQSGKDAREAVGHAVFNTLALNPVPQLVMPVYEVLRNKSSFTGAPIETLADQQREKADRYDERTSDVTRALGGASALAGLSPKQVEHLITGYSGTLGAYVLTMSDFMARVMTGREKASTPAADWPIVRTLYQGGKEQRNTMYQQRFIESLNKAREAYGSIKLAMDEQDPDRAQRLFEKRAKEMNARLSLERVQRRVSDINKAMRTVERNTQLSGSEKKERLQQLQRQKNELYEQAYMRLQLREW